MAIISVDHLALALALVLALVLVAPFVFPFFLSLAQNTSLFFLFPFPRGIANHIYPYNGYRQAL